jgi:predicted ATPase
MPRPQYDGRPFLLSGCSGGGKSALLGALSRLGYSTFEEAGRQIVREQHLAGGRGLPWEDADRFIEMLFDRARQQYRAATAGRAPNFLDRGLVEPFAWYRRTGRPVPGEVERAVRSLRYAEPVFLAPPWPEIFVGDAERRHGFEAATAEYTALVEAFALLGYRTIELPKTSIEARADFVLAAVRMTLSPPDRP